MTIFGFDTSHYDGILTQAILARAKSEGIVFFTHKIGEGDSNTDPDAAEAFAAAHAVGFEVIGGYYFIHPGTTAQMVAQADRCITLANQVAPWWPEFPGWFWQVDAEVEGGVKPTLSQIVAFADRLAARSGRTVVVYASAGEYGNSLTGLKHPLWNAHYGSNPAGAFKTVYPGDSSAGWDGYSGQTPALLQYGSNTTIAGLTTCDANAFRGTFDDLLKMIGVSAGGGDVPVTNPTTTGNVGSAVINDPAEIPTIASDADHATLAKSTLATAVYRLRVAVDKEATADRVAALADAVAALADHQAAAFTALSAQIAALTAPPSAGVTAAQEAAADRAAADVLDPHTAP